MRPTIIRLPNETGRGCFISIFQYSICHGNKANISTEKEETSPYSRIFDTQFYSLRQGDASAPPPQRSRQAFSIMPHVSRLTREDFLALAKKRPKVHFGRFFSLSFYPDTAQEAKIACVVAKKNVRHAVDRNKIKRRVREIVRPCIPTLPVGAYVLYTKKTAREAAHTELQTDIKELLGKV
jgi:ribonuclease P protein component